MTRTNGATSGAALPSAPSPRLPATAIERSFLPAALEIVETPASPSLRLTAVLIAAFFTAACLWASVGKVDLIATAPGKVVPVGYTKQVQAFDTGSIAKILVEDGMAVHEGQELILLDATLAAADRDRFLDAMMRATLDIARLSALITPPTEGRDPFAGVAADARAIEEARGRYRVDLARNAAKLASADGEIASKRAEAVGYQAEIARIDAQIPLVDERYEIRKKSAESGWSSRIELLNAAQAKVELASQRKIVAEKLKAAEAAVQAQLADRVRLVSEAERDWRADLHRAMLDRAQAASELTKAEHRRGLTAITAPTDGTVADLTVHTIGGVVQPGQPLLKIVPSSEHVTIDAVIENKDIGFVRPGQQVEIKVDAFPYTHYGLISGHVARIAKDADTDPELMRSAQPDLRASGDSPERLRRASTLVYVARIDMAAPSLMVDGVRTPIEPGMSVTAEIKTGQRTILDYVLSPLMQRSHDALRER